MNSLNVRRYVLIVLVIISFFMGFANGTITLVGRNPVISFQNTEAIFGPQIVKAVHGKLTAVRPLDACSKLHKHNPVPDGTSGSYFALVMRGGGCSYQQKLRWAEAAGFRLIVLHNIDYNEEQELFTMEEDIEDITVPVTFVSRESEEALTQLTAYAGVDVRITAYADSVDHFPWFDLMNENFVNWGVLFNFILLVLLILQRLELITLPYYPFGQPELELPAYNDEYDPPPTQMLKNSVKAMPRVVYNPEADRNRTDTCCVICLEDFTRGEELRLLPCYHRFHKHCIDAWLTKERAFCPICKHDARKDVRLPPIFVSNSVFFQPLPPIMVAP